MVVVILLHILLVKIIVPKTEQEDDTVKMFLFKIIAFLFTIFAYIISIIQAKGFEETLFALTIGLMLSLIFSGFNLLIIIPGFVAGVNNEFKRNGHGTWILSNGAKYEGKLKNDKREGHGTLILPSGAKYEGEYKNDKMNGQGIFILSDGSKYEGGFKNNNSEGHGTWISPSGEKYEGEFKNGKKEGQGIEYDKDGNILYQGLFKDGYPIK